MVWHRNRIGGQALNHFVAGILVGLTAIVGITFIAPPPLGNGWHLPADLILEKFVRERFVARRYDPCP